MNRLAVGMLPFPGEGELLFPEGGEGVPGEGKGIVLLHPRASQTAKMKNRAQSNAREAL